MQENAYAIMSLPTTTPTHKMSFTITLLQKPCAKITVYTT